MAKRNALIDGISSLTPPVKNTPGTLQKTSRFVSVSFLGGRSGFLDLREPRSVVWADVLDSLRQRGQPVYVEIDPATNIISELLCPHIVKVGAINTAAVGDDVEVELVISHARHYLRRSNPNFQKLLQTLQKAQEKQTTLLVTETLNTHEIIDVRPSPKLFTPKVPAAPPAPSMGPELAPVSSSRANELFNMVNAKICCPASAQAPCIPFLYPDDGCWGRAHEMCRLIIGAGVQPTKVWIYGRLRVSTSNNPNCQVFWGWHVAPTLSVSTGSGNQVYVIDPSLFSGPVPQATWVSMQGDSSAAVEPSTAAVFYRSKGGGYLEYDDAAYTKTQGVLNNYRNQLKLRSVGSAGPPPYISCLSKPAGVQWFGTIGPNATGQWFTYGWPAAWHIIWTVMPITPCPRGPQLSWTVQVERANATQCTYWITVKNLTSDPVRFEGRYDVLSR